MVYRRTEREMPCLLEEVEGAREEGVEIEYLTQPLVLWAGTSELPNQLDLDFVCHDSGTGAAVLGNPAESVAMLANMLGERGQEIPAGTFVMTGGVTAAVTVEPGDSILVRYHELGTLSMRFV